MLSEEEHRKLKQLIRLSLSPSANSHEAINAIERARHLALKYDYDLTRLLDTLPVEQSHVNVNIVVTKSPQYFPSKGNSDSAIYYTRMSAIMREAGVLSNLISAVLTRAAQEPTLFFDSAWQREFEETLESMSQIPHAVLASKPTVESLLQVHIQCMNWFLLYEVRAIRLTEVIVALKRHNTRAARDSLQIVSEISATLSASTASLSRDFNDPI